MSKKVLILIKKNRKLIISKMSKIVEIKTIIRKDIIMEEEIIINRKIKINIKGKENSEMIIKLIKQAEIIIIKLKIHWPIKTQKIITMTMKIKS